MAELLELAELTWQEARQQAAEGAIALVPTGAIEQHGPHLPLKVDTLLVNEVAKRAAASLETARVVLTPPLWLGVSSHHVDFFAASVDSLAYIALIEQLAASLIRGGFTRILFLNGHGGNTDPLKVAVKRIRSSAPLPVIVATVNYWSLATAAIDRIRESERGGISHAGELETSLMMHLDSAAVRGDLLEKQIPQWQPPYVVQDLANPGSVTLAVKWTALTDSGTVGDPTVASAAKGSEFLAEFVREAATLLQAIAGWEPSDGELLLS